jgi:hypothetical protein
MLNTDFLSYVPVSADLIKDLATAAITITNEDADYPDTNIGTQSMADVARTTAIPGGGVTIRIDLGANKVPRFWALLNHNITSGHPEIRSYNDNFVTLSGESKRVPFRELDAMLYYRGWTAKRYWEVNLASCTFADAFGLELGKLFVALDKTNFSMNFSPGAERGLAFRNVHNETEFGVRWSHVKQADINTMGLRWDPNIKEDLLDQLTAFIGATSGGAFPLILIPGGDAISITERLTNDGFDPDTAGWTLSNSAILASVAGGKSGNCLRITEGGANNPSAYQKHTLIPGKFYHAEVFVKAGTEDQYYFYIWDVNNAAEISIRTGTESAGDWTTVANGVFQAPAGCTTIGFYLRSLSLLGEGLNIFFDSATLYEVGAQELYYMRNQDAIRWDEQHARSIISKLGMKFIEESRGKNQVA